MKKKVVLPWICHRGAKWSRNSIADSLKSVRLREGQQYVYGHRVALKLWTPWSPEEISSPVTCGTERAHSLLLPTSEGEISCHLSGCWQLFKLQKQFCLASGLLLLLSEKRYKGFLVLLDSSVISDEVVLDYRRCFFSNNSELPFVREVNISKQFGITKQDVSLIFQFQCHLSTNICILKHVIKCCVESACWDPLLSEMVASQRSILSFLP